MEYISSIPKKQKLFLFLGLLFFAGITTFALFISSRNSNEVRAGNVRADSQSSINTTATVDFTSILRTINSKAVSMDESTYGRNKTNLTVDATAREEVKKLNLGYLRIHLAYATPGNTSSPIICHASGCANDVAGDAWIKAIRDTGAEPIIIVNQNAIEAAGLVRHFNSGTATKINRWIISNEPDNAGINVDAYTLGPNGFNEISKAMKAVDPTIKIGGPANSHFNESFITTFLDNAHAGPLVDFIDFHDYGEGIPNDLTEAQLLANAVEYESTLKRLRQIIIKQQPSRASQIETQIGEWNLSWQANDMQFQHFATIWAASTLGHQLRGGADYSFVYATKNGALGALYEYSDPRWSKFTQYSVNSEMPIYQALAMFTGKNTFPHFGTDMVNTTSSNPNLELFAFRNPQSVVIVNKDPVAALNTTMTFTGITSGSIQVWQKNSAMPVTAGPLKVADLLITNGSATYSFPAYSVSTLIFGPSVIPVSSSPIPTKIPPSPTRTILSPTSVLPSITSSPTAILYDSFTRTSTSGWGSAEKGGPYIRLSGTDSDYTVFNNEGLIRLTQTGETRGQQLSKTRILNVEESAKIHFSGTLNGAIYGSLLLRRSSSSSYNATITRTTAKTVTLKLSRFVGTKETLLSSELPLTNVSLENSASVWIKAQAVGSRPTTLRVKAWQDGQPEPTAWLLTASDRETLLQDEDTSGLSALLGTSPSKTLPVYMYFDSFSVNKASL